MTYDFKNLSQPQNTGSGIGEYMLVAPKSWFDTIAAPTAPFTLPGDSVTIKTAHTFKTPDVPNIRATAGAATTVANAITAIAVAIGGTGYVTAPAVTITGGGGTGAAATAILTNGIVTSVVVTNGGSGYNSAPTITFAAPPTKTYGFIKLQLVPQKNKLDAKSVGDLGLSKKNIEAEGFIGGSYAQLHETMKNLDNTPCIVLLPDANCESDIFYQLGCDCQSAWITSDFATGDTKGGAKGYTCKVMYDGGIKLYNVTDGPAILPG